MSIEFIDEIEAHELGDRLWSGGYDTWKTIYDADKEELLEEYINEVFCGKTPTITEINDLLWFDSSDVFEACGLDEDGEEPTNFEDDGEINDKYLTFLKENFENEACTYLTFEVEDVGKKVISNNNNKFRSGNYTTIDLQFSNDSLNCSDIDEETYNKVIDEIQAMKHVDTDKDGEIFSEYTIEVDTSLSYEDLKSIKQEPSMYVHATVIGRILDTDINSLSDFMDEVYNKIEDLTTEE